MLKFFVKSLGCKVSQYDGERLAEILRGCGLACSEDYPDLYIVNGCSVTGRASQKVRQILRSVRRRWPTVKIVLAGCEARLVTQRNQQTVEADWLLSEFDIDSVKKMLAALSLDVDEPGSISPHQPLTARTRAFLKIQDGCSQFCSYCIVAHLRGPEWSRPVSQAVKEAEELVNEGHRELVITGIHLGHYRPSLVELLRQLEKIPGLDRIRLSSIESIEVDEELIDWVATSSKACKHFHLPLQSGSDAILQAMRRPYATEDFRKVVEKIRKRIPLAAVTTDVIVGFPGETDALFAETMAFIKEMAFSRIHIFKFSPRDGTPAATMPDQVNNSIKSARSDMVEKIWQESALNYYRKFAGRTVEVLWETEKDGILSGFSGEYVPCRLSNGNQEALNRIETLKGVEVNDSVLLVSRL